MLTDGSVGQMMEPAELPPMQPGETQNSPIGPCLAPMAVRGASLTSIYLDPPAEEVTNLRLLRRWQEIESQRDPFQGILPG